MASEGGLPLANGEGRRRPGNRPRPIPSRILNVERSSLSTAYPPVGLRVTQAYVRLFFVPESEDGARTITLARFGNYEVRLVELVQSDGTCDPPLWVELYDRNIPGSIDSCSASDLEEMVCAAEQLLSEAKQLSEGAEPGHGSGKVEQHRSNESNTRTTVIH